MPPRSTAVPSKTAETEPTQRDRHLQLIAEKGRMGWQKASGYNKRARAEATIGRFKGPVAKFENGRGIGRVRSDFRGLIRGQPSLETKPVRPLFHLLTNFATGPFLSAQGPIYGHFRPRHHRMAASVYRAACAGAFRVWQEETCARRAG